MEIITVDSFFIALYSLNFIFHPAKFLGNLILNRTRLAWNVTCRSTLLEIREFPRDERLERYWENFSLWKEMREEIEEEPQREEERISSVCTSAVRDA